MSRELLDLADGVDANERDLLAFAPSLPPSVEAALGQAVDSRRAEAFTAILLAALHRGDALSADAFLRRGAPLLPDAAVLAGVAGHLEGNVGAALVAAAGDNKLGWDLEGVALLLAAFWNRRAGVEDPPQLMRLARVLSRKAPGGLADIALAALLGLSDDAGLEVGLGPVLDDQMRDEARDLAEGLVARFLGPILECVPETAGTRAFSGRPIQRATEKVGRNEPCHSGSGKKYKHCHERIDRDREEDASDVAGVTRAELRKALAEHLTVDRLNELRAHELAALDPAKVPKELHAHWLDRLSFHHEWEAIVAAYAALDEPDLDPVLLDHAGDAAWAGDRAAAHAILAHFHGDDPPLRAWARAALSEDPAEVGQIAEDAAREHLDAGAVEGAYALLRGPWPALGILAARSVLPHLHLDDAEPLLAELLDVRETLGLEPWDPVEDVMYLITQGHDPVVVAELTETEDRLRRNQAQLQGATAELRALRQQLETKSEVITQVVISPRAPAADPEAESLRARVAELKDELKERHAERNALRRELRDVKSQADPVESAPQPAPEPAEDLPEVEADAQHDGRLRLPTWSPTFSAALERVPPNVARAAVDRLCGIAVGNQGAFVEVRRIKHSPWLWRAKVGRSYRLLFRLDDEGIEALDLVHRQDLEKRIKQLS